MQRLAGWSFQGGIDRQREGGREVCRIYVFRVLAVEGLPYPSAENCEVGEVLGEVIPAIRKFFRQINVLA